MHGSKSLTIDDWVSPLSPFPPHRSNVGKSSLLNMVCNRKDLAYVSKRPGKTQQFNYFLVNDK